MDRVYLATLVAISALVQLWLARRYFGFLTGDDVEILTEAFRMATSYEYRPWDVRNLLVPDLIVAPFIRLGIAAGIHDSRTLIEIATLPFIAVSSITIVIVYRLALRWSNHTRAALVAATLFAFHWIPLAFGSTVYPRTIATACITGAALLIEGGSWSCAAAGALIGIAAADRYSELVYVLPLLLLARRRKAFLLGAVLSVTVTCGIYDWITWGTPFHSFVEFAKVTLLAPDFASRIKYQPFLWYLGMLARWCALPLIPLLWYARGERRSFLFVLLPLTAFSFIRHKELRYLQGIIPFLCIAAAIGFTRMPRRRIAMALIALAIPWNLYEIKMLRKKSMPAVMAARAVAGDPSLRRVALSQSWAYGDRIHLGGKDSVEIQVPPLEIARVLSEVDAVALYLSDLTPEIHTLLHAHGFAQQAIFRDSPARAVVLFRRSASANSDQAGRGGTSSDSGLDPLSVNGSVSGISDRARR